MSIIGDTGQLTDKQVGRYFKLHLNNPDPKVLFKESQFKFDEINRESKERESPRIEAFYDYLDKELAHGDRNKAIEVSPPSFDLIPSQRRSWTKMRDGRGI
ncbi:hypothetical protein KR054_010005 [Drosophila jambulina]|nr:hypothetical protein KR054_010005 [Drosophila jambulina]